MSVITTGLYRNSKITTKWDSCVPVIEHRHGWFADGLVCREVGYRTFAKYVIGKLSLLSYLCTHSQFSRNASPDYTVGIGL